MNKDSYAAENDMPYEKFLRLGSSALTEAELLAIIIRTGTKDLKPVEIGHKILSLPSVKSYGLSGLYHVTLKELMGIKGIGQVKAVKLKCLAELSMRMAMTTAKKELQFLNPSSVAKYYMEKLRHQEKEIILLLLLDNKLNLIEEYMVSMGTARASLLSAREVFIEALKCRACHLMLMHNHPSGDPHPSSQDIAITRKIKEAGELMDIPLIDHIILGDNCYMSLKEEDLL